MPQISACSSLGDKTALLGSIPNLKRRDPAQSKLDSFAWSAGLSFTAYGVRVGIRSNRVEVLEQSLDYLPVGWKPSSSPIVERLYSILLDPTCPEDRDRARFHLFDGSRPLLRYASESEVFSRLESDLALYVAEVTHRRIFVHAGVVGWLGRAILIPGRSCAGKTTLVAEMIRAGATYYSDEFAVLDEQGLVHPYARPLQLRESGGLQQTRRSVEEIGGVAGCVPLPPGLVLLCRYKPGAKWRPRHLSPGQALLGLLDNTVSARRGPAAALKTLKEVVTQSFAVKGTRGEGREVIDWMLAHFDPQKIFPISPV